MKKAFTLIELLVVIAIIAILAAILFPVFAQAKLAAKKTQVVSNAKQIGLAFQMYANDYDDTSPNLGDASPYNIVGGLPTRGSDWTDKLYPYVKNEDLFLNPLRNDRDSGGCATTPIAGYDEPGCRYVGFGYNWGPIKRRGGGLLLNQQQDPNLPAGNLYIPGINLSQVQNSGSTYAFQISYDTPRITMGMQFLLCTFQGTKNSDLFFSGNWPSVYTDSHVKSEPWVFGFGDTAAENHKFAAPANLDHIVNYCADPGYKVDVPGDSHSGVAGDDGEVTANLKIPAGTTCSQLPALFRALPHGNYDPAATTPTFAN